MSLVALDGTPLVKLGSLWSPGTAAAWAVTGVTQDAAKEATIMYGQVFTDDGGSHTIDTTGSSSLGWRTAGVTFANVGSTFKVGLAAMDLANGPPGRAANASDVITLDVSKSMAGNGGGVTANAWQEHVPDAGTKTVAHGDFIAFCTQMTALGGADLVNTSISSTAGAGNDPGLTQYTGGTYTAVSAVPNCLITFSDGHLGWFGGAVLLSSVTAQTWNSGSATKEYGNYLQFPFPVKIYGVYGMVAVAADFDFVLYSDPLGTPVAQKTVSVDANAVVNSGARPIQKLFSSPYSAAANQPLAIIAKPGGSNISVTYKTLNASAHQAADHCGTNGYAVNRASGAFAAQNSNKDRFAIGLLIGAWSQPARSATILGMR